MLHRHRRNRWPGLRPRRLRSRSGRRSPGGPCCGDRHAASTGSGRSLRCTLPGRGRRERRATALREGGQFRDQPGGSKLPILNPNLDRDRPVAVRRGDRERDAAIPAHGRGRVEPGPLGIQCDHSVANEDHTLARDDQPGSEVRMLTGNRDLTLPDDPFTDQRPPDRTARATDLGRVARSGLSHDCLLTHIGRVHRPAGTSRRHCAGSRLPRQPADIMSAVSDVSGPGCRRPTPPGPSPKG